MSRKEWIVASADRQAARELAEACGIDPLTALLLRARGYDDPVLAEEFLDLDQPLGDPFEIREMDRAVARIRRGLETGEKMAVFGDYDCDGVTAGVLLCEHLRRRGADVMLALPDRLADGYGIHTAQIDRLADSGVTLILTVDNGIAAAEEAAHAAARRVDMVITDHHLPPDEWPAAATAVVDPHRADETADFCDWAGVGVAFKLCCALDGCPCEELLPLYGDLVAIGTVADVVPLVGENRLLVAQGLRLLAEHPRPGLAALLTAAGLTGRPLTADTVGFGIAPRLNAAGRMGDAMRAARLLECTDPREADRLAAELEACNRQRHEVENAIVADAQRLLQENPALAQRRVIVLAGPGWHPGVLGIAAARLCEQTGKPCLLLSARDGAAHGSARSVGDFPLYDALYACREHLRGFGGHAQAAGLSLRLEELDAFRDAMEAYAASRGPMPFPPLRLDCKLTPQGLTPAIAAACEALAPFGQDNPAPLFGLFDMTLEEIRPVGGGRHLRLGLSRDGVRAAVMKFSTAPEDLPYERGDRLDLAVSLRLGDYQGQPSLSVIVRDIRPHGLPQREILSDIRLAEDCRRQAPLSPAEAARLLPDREQTAVLWRGLKGREGQVADSELLLARTGVDMPYAKALTALDALEELGLLDRSGGRWHLPPVTDRRELDQSPLLQRLRRLSGETDSPSSP